MQTPDVTPDLPPRSWRALLALLGRLPQGALSRAFGHIADLYLPPPLRPRVLGAFADGWSPVLRALVLTLVVVPLAVYVFVPLLLSGYVRLTSRLGRGEQ